MKIIKVLAFKDVYGSTPTPGLVSVSILFEEVPDDVDLEIFASMVLEKLEEGAFPDET